MSFKCSIESFRFTYNEKFESLESLKDFLKKEKILVIAFRSANVYEGDSCAFGDKSIEDLTEDDIDWLADTDRKIYESRKLVVMSISV